VTQAHSIRLIADVHLLPETTAISPINRSFHRFLDDCREQRITALYVLGDLFEMWVGDDIGLRDYAVSIEKLRQLSESGTRILLMEGNRDFLMRRAFYQATGIQRIKPPYPLVMGGKNWLLLHGDELCTDDRAFQRMRRVLRNPLVMWGFLRLPGSTRQRIGRSMRDQSQKHGSNKPQNIMDVSPQAVERLLQKHPKTDWILHGHTHRPGIHGRRWVLGDWRPQAWYVEGSTDHGSASWHYWR
jgi:UDP-2,3-diacylglucosamine hydrolase